MKTKHYSYSLSLLATVTLLAATWIGLPVPSALGATLTTPTLIRTHSVLQRGMSVPIWGTGTAGTTVTVQFNGQNVPTTVATDGTWRVNLASMAATTSPQTMTITSSDSQTLTYTDVQVGEVWGCSGQSNMEYKLSASDGGSAAVADAPNHNLRLFEMKASDTPDLHNWTVSDATTSADFSAVCYYFGRELSQDLNVPIGLIQTTSSGTAIEEWSHFAGGTTDGHLYDIKIKTLMPYGIKGFTWYQGEANPSDFTYYDQLKGLIEEWRAAWGQGNFAFGIVELPFNRPPLIREQELHAFQTVPGTFLSVISDLPDLGGTGGHPANKAPVGLRLAIGARSIIYGEAITDSVGPIPNPATSSVSGNTITIGFTHVGSGLVTGSEWEPGGAPSPFQVAGLNGTFAAATATIVGNTLQVSSASVPNPVWVRYTWDYSRGNLYSTVSIPIAGGASTYTRLPATTFELIVGTTVTHVDDIFTTDINGTPKTTFTPGSTLYWRVKVLDRNNNPVAGATVSSTLFKPNHQSMTTVTGLSGADGWALLSLKLSAGAASGTYNATVSNITKTNSLYELTENFKTMTLFAVQ